MISASKSPHFKALKQLFPLKMDAEEYAVALELDRALASADDAYKEIFPSTAVKTLKMWENLYGLEPAGTEEERRQALLVKVNQNSGIAAKHYEAMAALMGFEVHIVRPPRLFRAGVSRAGAPCYDLDEQYTWEVKLDYLDESCYELVKVFEREKIPFTAIRWKYGLTRYIATLTDEDGIILTDEDNHDLIYEFIGKTEGA